MYINESSAILTVDFTEFETATQTRLNPESKRSLRLYEDEEKGIIDVNLKIYQLKLSLLKLDDDLVKVLKSSQLEKLSTFNLNKDPAKQVKLMGKLSAKYGDDVVARTLVTLQEDVFDNPRLQAVLKQLRAEQVDNWLRKDLPVVDVVTLLKFERDASVFRSKALPVLEDYIQAKPRGESLVNTLTKFYGDETKLYAMIVRAMSNDESVAKAMEVEQQLIAKWQSAKMPAKGVWNRLKFGEYLSIAMNTGKVDTFWAAVSTKGEVLKQLTAKYGEAEVALVMAGRKSSSPAAVKLQEEQLTGWMNKEMPTNEVFGLGLPQKLDVLDTYIKLLKTENPQDELITVLRNGFKDDEGGFALMLSVSLRELDSGPMKETFRKSQQSLFKQWNAKKSGPDRHCHSSIQGIQKRCG